MWKHFSFVMLIVKLENDTVYLKHEFNEYSAEYIYVRVHNVTRMIPIFLLRKHIRGLIKYIKELLPITHVLGDLVN